MSQQWILVFGGKSTEHEISLRSAEFLWNQVCRDRFDVERVYINSQGFWSHIEKAVDFGDLKNLVNESKEHDSVHQSILKTFVELNLREDAIFFPIVHGTGGEDGKLQGFIDQMGFACAGAEVLGAAVSMNKSISKRIAESYGVPVLPWVEVSKHQKMEDLGGLVSEKLSYPVIVKPANLGSAVGITCVQSPEKLRSALDAVFLRDVEALVEPFLKVREVEVGVLGSGGEVEITEPGEIQTKGDGFYDYDNKYNDTGHSKVMLPANLDSQTIQFVKSHAKTVYEALRLSGYARVDFFLNVKDGSLYFNEVNPLPGFTSISLYPRLWEHQGLKPTELITRLSEEAVKVFRHSKALKTTLN